MKLFAVYLGGKASGANIEVHDLVFVVGKEIKSCFSDIKGKWFGDQNSVHIDSYAELSIIDRYEISLSLDKIKNKNNLFFVNLGFADPTVFGEGHLMSFIIAPNASEAKIQAKKMFPKNVVGNHLDNLIKLSQIDTYYINVIPTDKKSELHFTNVYWKL